MLALGAGVLSLCTIMMIGCVNEDWKAASWHTHAGSASSTFDNDAATMFPALRTYINMYERQLIVACHSGILDCKDRNLTKLLFLSYYEDLARTLLHNTHPFYGCRTGLVQCHSIGGWPALGTTMTSIERLDNVRHLLTLAYLHHLPGHFVEAGVWRGGTSIYAALVLRNMGFNRDVYVCDSFQGLPAPRGELYEDESIYQQMSYLSVPLEDVQASFKAFSVLDHHAKFIKGYFVDTMPILRSEMMRSKRTISVLRLDGDMYESTMDVLCHLYELVDVGGHVIVDDWSWDKEIWHARQAVLDFREAYGIEDDDHKMVNIDNIGAFFQKTRAVEVSNDCSKRTFTHVNATRQNDLKKRWDTLRPQWWPEGVL